MDKLGILATENNNIFQSKIWADLHENMGRKTWLINSGNTRTLLIKYPLFRNRNYLYCPRGPLFNDDSTQEDFQDILSRIRAISKEENVFFCRMEPYVSGKIDMQEHGFMKVTRHAPLSRQYSPQNTLVLNLKNKEEELLAAMKSKCRYNINLSRRKGVVVRNADKLDDIDIFYQLNLDLENRGQYHGHEYDYYRQLFLTLSKSNHLKLFIAEHDGQPLAAILVTFFGEVATYLHGASSREKRELMPSYALQWAAIKEAMNRGCTLYDFWGVAPAEDKEHPWSGISRFKRGFGGEEIGFGEACDLALNKTGYKLLCSVNLIKKRLR